MISVVIALAPGRKAEVIESLKNLNYSGKYEIIIKEGLNPSENRNNGVREAKGEIIAFLDDDAYVHKDLFNNAKNFFKENERISIVGGPQLTPRSDGVFAKLTGIAMASYFGSQNMSKRYKRGRFDLNSDEFALTSANCFVRKDDFKKIGGFNTNLFPGEDPEFFARAKNKGYLIAYNPDLIVYHKRRATYKEFFKQFYKYGNTRLKKEQYVKSKNGFIFFLPALFTVYFIPLLLLGIILHKIFLMPLVSYGLFALAASVYESVRNNCLYGVVLIPFLYMSMHIAYGCGILVSLIKISRPHRT